MILPRIPELGEFKSSAETGGKGDAFMKPKIGLKDTAIAKDTACIGLTVEILYQDAVPNAHAKKKVEKRETFSVADLALQLEEKLRIALFLVGDLRSPKTQLEPKITMSPTDLAASKKATAQEEALFGAAVKL